MSYAIIGFGKLGQALAKTLARSGIEVSVATTRDPESFASTAAAIGPEIGHSGIEFFLPAAEDEDESALVDEALCCGAADAGGASGDHGGLPIQSVHDVHSSSELYEGSGLLAEDLGSSPMKTID